MMPWRQQPRPQFSLRSMLGGMTWLALVIAVCVAHQQAAARQRVVLEQLKASGLLPVTTINGQRVPSTFRPAPSRPTQP